MVLFYFHKIEWESLLVLTYQYVRNRLENRCPHDDRSRALYLWEEFFLGFSQQKNIEL